MPDRRTFLKQAVAGAVLGFGFREDASAGLVPGPEGPREAADRVALGATGLTVSFLAQGTGTRGGGGSSEQVKLGAAAFTRLVRHGLDRGISLFDLAGAYGCHAMMREALRGVPREAYVLQTKIEPPASGESPAPPGAVRREIDRYRAELGTDAIDICLLHAVTGPRWAEDAARARDELARLRQDGILRAAGVSCHSLEALEAAASDPWVDVILARINPGGPDYAMDGDVPDVARLLRRARGAGKGVIGMKLLGAGRLARPESRNASLHLVIRNRLVDAVAVGMTRVEEIDDMVSRIRTVSDPGD